jgi:hypothetical protein
MILLLGKPAAIVPRREIAPNRKQDSLKKKPITIARPHVMWRMANTAPNSRGEKCTPIREKVVPRVVKAVRPFAKQWTPFTMKNIPKNDRMNNFPKFSLSKLMEVLTLQLVKKFFSHCQQNDACLLTKYQ